MNQGIGQEGGFYRIEMIMGATGIEPMTSTVSSPLSDED